MNTIKLKGMITCVIILLLSSNVLVLGQQISGTVFEMNSDIPVEYANIGIVGKNVGTVSDQNGNYTLEVKPEYDDDTLKFSCIGYHPYSVKVADFINLNNGNIYLEKRLYELVEVVVRPKKIKQKTLGITTTNKIAVACSDSIYGGEIGVVMKNKNKALLKEINIKVAHCSYDTVFYRLNIYRAQENMLFDNILSNPVFFSLPKEEVKDHIKVDLRDLQLVVEGDFLVTIEVIKNLGPGVLCYPASILHKSYFRKTSQGEWKTIVAGISISAIVDVER